MEREYWRWIARGLKRLPRRRPRGAVYDNREALAVLLWAALHDRSIDWACRRSSWPMQAWRRRLPDQSTMSRRLRDPSVQEELRRLAAILQRGADPSGTLIADGKALAVSEFTRDPDATRGWGTGRFAKGFRVHALIDDAMRIIAWDARGLNEAECVVAADLVRDARDHGLLPPDATVIADASYDSNPLHAAVHDAGSRLLAPRRRPDRPLAANRRHHPARIEAVRFTEHDPGWERLRLCVRTTIERVFGIVAGGACRLHALPPWVRRIHRVKLWVSAKLVVYAASWAHRHAVDA